VPQNFDSIVASLSDVVANLIILHDCLVSRSLGLLIVHRFLLCTDAIQLCIPFLNMHLRLSSGRINSTESFSLLSLSHPVIWLYFR
jgi:hypothetical protein